MIPEHASSHCESRLCLVYTNLDNVSCISYSYTRVLRSMHKCNTPITPANWAGFSTSVRRFVTIRRAKFGHQCELNVLKDGLLLVHAYLSGLKTTTVANLLFSLYFINKPRSSYFSPYSSTSSGFPIFLYIAALSSRHSKPYGNLPSYC